MTSYNSDALWRYWESLIKEEEGWEKCKGCSNVLLIYIRKVCLFKTIYKIGMTFWTSFFLFPTASELGKGYRQRSRWTSTNVRFFLHDVKTFILSHGITHVKFFLYRKKKHFLLYNLFLHQCYRNSSFICYFGFILFLVKFWKRLIITK